MPTRARSSRSLIVHGRVRRAFLGIVGGTRPLPEAVANRIRSSTRPRGRSAARARAGLGGRRARRGHRSRARRAADRRGRRSPAPPGR
jgi:hypothetical protein